MYLVSAFRRAALQSSAAGRSMPRRAAAQALLRREQPSVETPRQAPAAPQLTCRWEEGEEQQVRLGHETFHVGRMFLHWMPVH
jgi:hypothetical protein